MKSTPTISQPSFVPSTMMPSMVPACCSFDGKACGWGIFCSSSKRNCEVSCSPGKWIIIKAPSLRPSAKPIIAPSHDPSSAPLVDPSSCCSFDNGMSCGGGEYCNRSRSNCEDNCPPGQWVTKAETTAQEGMVYDVGGTLPPVASPTVTPKEGCCSFNEGVSCGGGTWCNKSLGNCEKECSGTWFVE